MRHTIHFASSGCFFFGGSWVANVDKLWLTWSYMGVSKNNGTPKSSILIGVFHYKPSILGYPYFWKHPYDVVCLHGLHSRWMWHLNIVSRHICLLSLLCIEKCTCKRPVLFEWWFGTCFRLKLWTHITMNELNQIKLVAVCSAKVAIPVLSMCRGIPMFCTLRTSQVMYWVWQAPCLIN